MVIEDGVDYDVVKNLLPAAVAVEKDGDAFLREGTPERAEFENSIADEATEDDQLSEIDEDEWTETNNFAISNNSGSGGASSPRFAFIVFFFFFAIFVFFFLSVWWISNWINFYGWVGDQFSDPPVSFNTKCPVNLIKPDEFG